MSAVGFLLSGATAVGSAMCEFGRKKLTSSGLDSATIVSLVCLLQGVLGFSGLAATGRLSLPGRSFWAPALASAACSACTATLLTKAYSLGEMSLCAPFNAALPVFQFFVTSFVLHDEERLPVHKLIGVAVVVAASFVLARAGRASSHGRSSLLPPGAALVLLCCAVWSFVTKFDQEATRAAGSALVYVCYAKTLTGLWAAFGASLLGSGAEKGGKAGGGAAARSLRLLRASPRLSLVLLGVAITEACYMGCYFAALTRVSKVVVVAVKKGGNLLVSSAGGVLLFGEKAEGRVLPVLGVVVGVALMSV